MLTLVLVLALIVFVAYRKKSGKRVFPAEFFKDQLSRTPPDDYPPFKLMALFILVMVIITSYAGMFTFMQIYDEVYAEITQYKYTISQLEAEVSEIDKSIEEIKSDSKLQNAEKSASLESLAQEKQSLENEISANTKALNRLPLGMTPERLQLYKFLIYFG